MRSCQDTSTQILQHHLMIGAVIGRVRQPVLLCPEVGVSLSGINGSAIDLIGLCPFLLALAGLHGELTHRSTQERTSIAHSRGCPMGTDRVQADSRLPLALDDVYPPRFLLTNPHLVCQHTGLSRLRLCILCLGFRGYPDQWDLINHDTILCRGLQSTLEEGDFDE